MGDDFIFTPETCKLIKNILHDSINIIKLINEIKRQYSIDTTL